MMENVPQTTNTIGNVRETRRLFSGQQNTRTYSDEEKSQLFKNRTATDFGQDWADPNANRVISQGEGE